MAIDDVLAAAKEWATCREDYRRQPSNPRAGEAMRLAEDALAASLKRHEKSSDIVLDPALARWLEEGGRA